MKKRLEIEDAVMVFQWVVVLMLVPFIIIPFSSNQPYGVGWRALEVGLLVFATCLFTAGYLIARRHSRKAAVIAIEVIAAIDVLAVFTALLLWPDYLPDIFWIFPLVVIVVAALASYREAIMVLVALCILYALTIITRVGGSQPNSVVIGDTLNRIGYMVLLALAALFITQREKLQRRDARILSDVGTAIGSKLEVDELMQAVVEGINQAAGLGRCSIFFVSGDGRWAVPQSTTEKGWEARKRFFDAKIDLHKENIASRVIEERRPIVITDPETNRLVDRRWIEDFDVGALLALPIMLRDEVKGVAFVESRRNKKHFEEREIKTSISILAQASAGLANALRYKEEQKKRSESDTLYRTIRELGSTLDVDQVAESACKLAMGATDSSGCTVFLADESRGMMVPRVSLGGGGAKRSRFPEGSEMKIDVLKDVFSLAQRPSTLTINRPEENTALPPFLRAEGAVVLVPFYSHGRMAGLLCVSDSRRREYGETQLSQLAAMAGEVSLAILNARLYERIRSDAAQMASLVQLANAIGSTADLESIVSIALETVRHLFDCNSGVIYRVDEDEGTLNYVDSFGYPPEVRERLTSPPYPDMAECWTVEEGRLICVDDLSVTKVACRTLEKIGTGSAICVGMQVEGRTVGVLHIRAERPEAFREEDQQLALAIADQVALAIQRAILFEEINRLAITDPLTGVFNVRRLEAVLGDEVSRANRYNRPVSFLMVDMDNLKGYNDTLGHQQGDVALSQVASIIDTNTRDVDKVFRYGGDEFCVVLPETEGEEAMVVADKVRKAVAEFHFPGEEKVSEKGLTISVGVASLPGDAGDAEGLIRSADQALYNAKQAGRDTVAASGSTRVVDGPWKSESAGPA